MAVAVLHRPVGLTDADRQFALRLSRTVREHRIDPNEVVRVLGPASIPEIAGRMVSRDGTVGPGRGLAFDVICRTGYPRCGRVDGPSGEFRRAGDSRRDWSCAGRATR